MARARALPVLLVVLALGGLTACYYDKTDVSVANAGTPGFVSPAVSLEMLAVQPKFKFVQDASGVEPDATSEEVTSDVPTCSDEECEAEGKVCWEEGGVCVACVIDDDCGAGKLCVGDDPPGNACIDDPFGD